MTLTQAVHVLKSLGLLIGSTFLGLIVPVRASIIGASVDVKAEYPSMGTVFLDGGVKTVGAGVEYPSGSFGPSYNTSISVDLTGTQIIISLNGTSTSFTLASFNGFDITFLTGSITGATANASSNFNPVITIIGNDLFLNYQGRANASGSSIIDVTGTGSSAAPEPASLGLLGSALVGLALLRLRKT